MKVALLLLGSYLLGAVPIGLLAGQIAAGIDVRNHGSRNIGASNVWRTLKAECGPVWGPFWGIVTFVLDVAKGCVPVIAARHFVPHVPWLPVLAGLLAIVGHNASVFLGFQGGKGVATSLGVAAGLSWPAALIGFGAWLVVLALTRYISVASMVATPLAAIFLCKLSGWYWAVDVFACAATVFVFVRHRANLTRLRTGAEPKVQFGRNK